MIWQAGILHPTADYVICVGDNATHRICSGRGAAGGTSYARPIQEQVNAKRGVASNIMPPVYGNFGALSRMAAYNREHPAGFGFRWLWAYNSANLFTLFHSNNLTTNETII